MPSRQDYEQVLREKLNTSKSEKEAGVANPSDVDGATDGVSVTEQGEVNGSY